MIIALPIGFRQVNTSRADYLIVAGVIGNEAADLRWR
jgi:hypothetical protein